MQCNSTNKTQFKIDIRTVKQEASYLLGLDVSVNLNMDTLCTVLKGVKRHFFDVGTTEHSTSDCLYLGCVYCTMKQ